MSTPKLNVSVKGAEKTLREGEADSVSSVNSQGPFDILPLHSNFISVIENKPIIIRVAKEKKEYTFPFSVIYAHVNKVQIFTNL
jgi:F0F1-type ATP synthase epsilon subunit